MLKKVFAYQKLLNRSGQINGTLFIPVIFVIMFLNSMIQSMAGLNFNGSLVAVIAFTYAYEVILKYPKKMLRSLPVSDNFAVANLLFVVPVYMMFFLVVVLSILFLVLSVVVAMVGKITAISYMDNSFFTDIYQIITIENLCKIIFVFSVCLE